MTETFAAKLLLFVLLVSAFNTGLIWIIQLVHYPGFLKIPASGYVAYQQFHMRSISWIVAPSMVMELLLSLLIFTNGQYVSNVLYLAATAALLVIWVSTFFFAVPLHGSLVGGYDAQKIQSLVNINWVRTISWSLRTGMLTVLVLRFIR